MQSGYVIKLCVKEFLYLKKLEDVEVYLLHL